MVDELNSPGRPQPPAPDRLCTVPNALCLIRLLGAPVLLALAFLDHQEAFFWLFIALAVSDWIDGKLAVLLDQRSAIGPRLDSWADAALYGALFLSLLWLHGTTLHAELPWILPALASYAFSVLTGLRKFKRWPSYHTRAAKISWFLILAGSVCLLGQFSLWPLRTALAVVTLANIEAIAITLLSPAPRSDVESVITVLCERHKDNPR